jgi:tetratricopeptide (TPR) repeat protein
LAIEDDAQGNRQEETPIGAEERLHHAIALHRQGRLAEAEQCYEQILREHPGNADALHLLGVVALHTGRPERGVGLIETAIGIEPNFASAHSNRGAALQELGRFAEAVASYERAIALKPDYAEAHNNRGVVLAALGRFDEAIASYERAIALRPNYAEAHSNRGAALQELGRFAEAVASYERAIALKPDYDELHRNRGVVLAALGRFAEAVASYDRAIALKPDYAEACCKRGNALQALKRFEEAVASYDRAIALRPDYAEACNNRGVALLALGRLAEAVASYDRAIALKPDYAEAHSNRGFAMRSLGLLDEAIASCERAIALRPEYAEACNNRGVALHDLKRFAEAIASYDRAIGLRPDYAEPYFNKSLCSLVTGDLAQGWELYEWRKKKANPSVHRRYPQRAWLGGEPLAGKAVFLHWEQGFGDTIQFCRYARLLRRRCARVVMSVQDPLVRLLVQMEPEIEILGADQDPGTFDFHCPMMSLPLAFGTTLETIPSAPAYLASEPDLRERWDARLPAGARPRIGLVWTGRPTHDNDRNRSMEGRQIRPLLSLDADWFCLQKEVREGDVATLKDCGRIVFLGDGLEDFADTAAVISLLDLVISVDTSVAHLAGALGKPVWVLLPFCPDWRWLVDRDESPWYPSARLFRQPRIGDWAAVVERVKSELPLRFR